ncbi:MAG: hypothetical protein IMZ52_06740 [Actinobacteria bacterium]|nr:hypothetical protein [Actinomycetota bacterium]
MKIEGENFIPEQPQQLSDEEAKRSYELFSKGYKELLEDPDFLRYALGNALFRKSFYDLYLNTLTESQNDRVARENIVRGEEERKSDIDMFSQLLKGEFVVNIFKKNRHNVSQAQHHCGNLGRSFVRYYPESSREKISSLRKEEFGGLVQSGLITKAEALGQVNPTVIADGVISGYLNSMRGSMAGDERNNKSADEAKMIALQKAQDIEKE